MASLKYHGEVHCGNVGPDRLGATAWFTVTDGGVVVRNRIVR